MGSQQDDKELEVLKANIGFKTAFKATLGFYAAQFLAQLAGLAILVSLGVGVLGVLYLIFR
ncbi:MAG: hypothetical protein ACREBR_04590 [bacterium]